MRVGIFAVLGAWFALGCSGADSGAFSDPSGGAPAQGQALGGSAGSAGSSTPVSSASASSVGGSGGSGGSGPSAGGSVGGSLAGSGGASSAGAGGAPVECTGSYTQVCTHTTPSTCSGTRECVSGHWSACTCANAAGGSGGAAGAGGAGPGGNASTLGGAAPAGGSSGADCSADDICCPATRAAVLAGACYPQQGNSQGFGCSDPCIKSDPIAAEAACRADGVPMCVQVMSGGCWKCIP